MNITLDDEEVRSLTEALDAYLPELRFELSRTDREPSRHRLAVREERLTALRKKLP